MDKDKDKIDIYLDFNVLNLLAKEHVKDSDPLYNEWMALKTIWRAYQEGRIRLVTSGEDTEMDIIMWLNNQGCCVTDVLTPLESIEEFARWDRSDSDLIRYWRRVFFYFEQTELLSRVFEDTEGLFEDLQSTFSFSLVTPKFHIDLSYNEQDTRKILRECAGIFADIFPEQNWQDLRHIDYSLNWRVFELALKNLKIEPTLSGDEGERNRRLFGLLNRFIGLSKKSCKKPPMDNGHRDFIIDMVIKKYYQTQQDRGLRHIFHCICNDIGFFVTPDHNLIRVFNEKKQLLNEHPEFSSKRLELVLPSELKKRVKDL